MTGVNAITSVLEATAYGFLKFFHHFTPLSELVGSHIGNGSAQLIECGQNVGQVAVGSGPGRSLLLGGLLLGGLLLGGLLLGGLLLGGLLLGGLLLGGLLLGGLLLGSLLLGGLLLGGLLLGGLLLGGLLLGSLLLGSLLLGGLLLGSLLLGGLLPGSLLLADCSSGRRFLLWNCCILAAFFWFLHVCNSPELSV